MGNHLKNLPFFFQNGRIPSCIGWRDRVREIVKFMQILDNLYGSGKEKLLGVAFRLSVRGWTKIPGQTLLDKNCQML